MLIKKLINDFRLKSKLKKIDEQLPDALALLKNAQKAGLSFTQALEMAAMELPDPLGGEIKNTVAQLKLGLSVEDALLNLEKRLQSDDVALIVQSVVALRMTGGNLVETFGTLSSTIEGRHRVEGRIRVLTAQGVYQGAALLLMPWLLGFAIYCIAPDYLGPLLTTSIGWVFIIIGILLEAAGALWLKHIVTIRV